MKISTTGLIIAVALIIVAIGGASFGFYQMGRSIGFETGEKAGMVKGLLAGEKAGYQKGYNEGKAEGDKSGYNNGYAAVEKLVGLLSSQFGDGSGLYEGEQVGYNDGYSSAYYTTYPAGWQTGWLAGYQYLYVNANADVDVTVSGDQKPPVKPDLSNLPAPGSVQIPKPPDAPSFQLPEHQSRFNHSSVPNRPSLPGGGGLRR